MNPNGLSGIRPPHTTLNEDVSITEYCSECRAVVRTRPETMALPLPLNQERSVDSMLQECHGGRSFHYGASRTWQLAKERIPQAKISIRQVMDYVRECPLCQKTRATGIGGLVSRTLSLKPSHYRRTVGVDLTTVTPVDNNGNTCVILVVEHFSHYPVAYPSKDYTADSVAKALFKHYCSHGTFDQVASDPGSVFMSEVVSQLNSWLSISHKVSLVGRHQSNGCEASSAQFLRHLRTLVLDERLYHQWSDDTVLPLVNLETGGFTPLQLKYGTLDAARFNLPEQLILPPGVRAAKLIKDLDENLQTIRAISRELQAKLTAERAAADRNISQYEPGDLVLFNPREKQSDFLATKLTPDWLGPYQVVQQLKNDVTARHIVLHTEAVLHVERLKPFFGTYEDALLIARHDHHQYAITCFNFYRGNPFVRTSLIFNVTFEDGTIEMPYGGDFINSQQFDYYILSQPELYPLRFPAKLAIREVRNLEKLAITSVMPNTEAFVNLRIYDGRTSMWYDSLNLPNPSLPYIVRIYFTRWYNRNNHLEIEAIVPFFGPTHSKYKLILSAYDIRAFIFMDLPYWTTILLEDNDRRFPQILSVRS